MGGVTKWQDVVEIMMAGATLVGVGTAVYFKGMGIYDQFKKDLSEYLTENKIKNLSELVGIAH